MTAIAITISTTWMIQLRGDGIGIFYPSPMYRAEVVLAAPDSSAEDLLDDDALAEALTAEGWSDDEIDTSLPDIPVLYALREEF